VLKKWLKRLWVQSRKSFTDELDVVNDQLNRFKYTFSVKVHLWLSGITAGASLWGVNITSHQRGSVDFTNIKH